jgi:proteasome lid subunit RPN8/RPN11
MLRIEPAAWSDILAHVEQTYPEECCGAMLGGDSGGEKLVRRAVPIENAYPGSRKTRYEIRPEDLLAATHLARQSGLDLVGIYHSHPDREACFSVTDLENSCPWYAFVVVSIHGGRFDHAQCWLPNQDRTSAAAEPLWYPEAG